MKIEDFIEKYQGTVATNFADSGLPKLYSNQSFAERAENNLSKLIKLQRQLELAQNPVAKKRIQGQIDSLQENQSKFGEAIMPIGTRGRGGTEIMQKRMERMDLRPEFKEKQDVIDEEQRIIDENDAKKAEKDRLIKEEAEYRDSFKGRLQTLFEDSGKRDAILAGISETMLETRTGADVYGSRLADVGKNVRSKIQEQEALSMIKDQAILDMMKTSAETQAANNPMQFLSNTQKNARDYATAQGATANPPFAQGSKEWAAAYAQGLENMAMENLIMAPVEGIAAINELLARNTGMFDEATIKVFKDVIANLTGRITGDGGAINTNYNTIIGKTDDGVDSN